MQESQVIEIGGSKVSVSPLDHLLGASLKTPEEPAPRSLAAQGTGVLVGTLEAFSPEGFPLVRFDEMSDSEPLPARYTCDLSAADVGRAIVLLLEAQNPRKPIVIGVVQDPSPINSPAKAAPLQVSVDGEQVTLSAKHEIVLRCGKASITLTRAGKVLIRGAYLLSRSSGVNRIKGGSVQIN
jgi:hypothetical protein